MATINATVIVDAEGLIDAYPNGSPRGGSGDLQDYYCVSVPSQNNGGQHTIKCQVNDVIRFRALPETNASRAILVFLFADEMTSGGDPQDKIGGVTFFDTTVSHELHYAHASNSPSPGPWPGSSSNYGWTVYTAPTGAETKVKDSYLQVNALEETGNNEVRYSLGFKIRHEGNWLSYFYDPYIQIESTDD